MKNKYLFSSKMKAFNNRWLCIASLLLAGLFNVTSAFAGNIAPSDANIFAAEVKYKVNGVEKTYNAQNQTITLDESVTSFEINSYTIHAWQKESFNLCNVASMCWQITGKPEHWIANDLDQTNWHNWEGSNWPKSRKPDFSAINLTENVLQDLTEGTYTLELRFYIKGGNGCNDISWFNNGGQNYKINFTVGTPTPPEPPVTPTSELLFLGDLPEFNSAGDVVLSAYLKKTNCNIYHEYGVMVGTDPAFAEGTFSTHYTQQTINSHNSKTLLKQSVPGTGILSGTQYYYKFYIKSNTGGIAQEWTSVGQFLIPTAQRVAAIKLVNGADVEYLYMAKVDPNVAKQSVSKIMPCDGSYTYQLVYKNSREEQAWTPVGTPTALQPEFLGHNLLFEASLVGDQAQVTVTPLSNNFKHFIWDVEFTQGQNLNIHIEGNDNVAYYVGAGGQTDQIPEGTQYTIYRTLQNTENKCVYAAPQAVPAELTGKLTDKGLVSVNYASGETQVTFAKQRGLWAWAWDSKNTFVGQTHEAKNTFVPITCNGNQGTIFADYALIYNNVTTQCPLGVDVKEGNNKVSYTNQWNYNSGGSPIIVRYLYNSADNKAVVHPIYLGNTQKPMQIVLSESSTHSGNQVAHLTAVEGQENVYQAIVDNLNDYSKIWIEAADPNSNYTRIWSDQPQALQHTQGSAIFTYNLMTNCLKVQYTGAKDLALLCDKNAITITKDGQVSIVVTNVGGTTIDEGEYSLDVQLMQPDEATPQSKVVMNGALMKIEPGQSVEFKSALGVVTHMNNYTLSAEVICKGDVNPDNNYCVKETCTTDLSADPLIYTINSSFFTDSDCRLQYRSFEAAFEAIKANAGIYDVGTKLLKKNITMNVVKADAPYVGTYDPGAATGGEAAGVKAILIEDINNNGVDGVKPDKILKIQAADAKARPTLGHVIIRRSKGVLLDGLNIQGDPTVKDNALDIDFAEGTGKQDWLTLVDQTGKWKNANIGVVNSYITSYGFTCIHAAGIDGLLFENNDIEAKYLPKEGEDISNTTNWGSSAKFLRSSKVEFVRNNFRGAHATTLWLQEPQQALVMNNVFWNTNTAVTSDQTNKVAFLRLVSQGLDCNQIGIYYNTMYLADAGNVKPVDFIRLGGDNPQQKYQGDPTTVEFLYNNCYSYDPKTPGKAAQGGQGDQIVAQNNNFWSMYTAENPNRSVFAVGEPVQFINVEENVCTTASTDPASLVIKGGQLNLGAPIQSDASGLGAENMKGDRLHTTAVRPTTNTWTYGAYQTTDGETVSEIIWNGLVDNDWDNRGNWYKMVGGEAHKLTCVDKLSANLKVIIPAPNSTQYVVPAGGIKEYPQLPSGFDMSQRRIKRYKEQVDAGMTAEASVPTMFAQSIELENGASIRGVEALNGYYGSATTHFTADREDWILVGTVVKPFASGNSGAVRNIQSADFYRYHEPHVYMHQSRIEGSDVVWDAPFTSLEEEVAPEKVFAIQAPDQYGPYKFPAAFYYTYMNPNANKTEDGTKPLEYTFTGKFANDTNLPKYQGKSGQPSLVCNTYPANINLDALSEKGTVYYYDYHTGSFNVWAANLKSADNASVKSQNGFVFIPNADGLFVVEPEMFEGTSTQYRSAEAVQPYVIVEAAKMTDGKIAPSSVVNISYNELKDDNYNAATDKDALLAITNENVPLIYIMEYGKKLQTLEVAKQTKIIPLGLQLGSDMTFTFDATQCVDYDEVVLEDRTTGFVYDLRKFKAEFTLTKGVYEGRFFLNLKGEGEGIVDPEVPTDIEETESDLAGDTQAINIVADQQTIIVSSTEGVELQDMYITDMAGRTIQVGLSGHYGVYHLTAAQGVYVVHVVGDTQSKSQKVIIK